VSWLAFVLSALSLASWVAFAMASLFRFKEIVFDEAVSESVRNDFFVSIDWAGLLLVAEPEHSLSDMNSETIIYGKQVINFLSSQK
jgi:hypothetical protein